MGNKDAEQRFFEAVKSFRIADDKARGDLGNIDTKAFQMVIIDLDAAIPGLSGVILGRALVLKAACFYWLHLEKLSKVLVFDVYELPDPLLEEGLSYALRGRKILEELGSTVDLPWANGVVENLGDH